MDQIFEVHVPKRTRHRQNLPPWISSFISYNMKRLQTQFKCTFQADKTTEKNPKLLEN